MKKGFSLIELLVVIALLAVITAALSFTFAAGLRSWSFGRNYAEITEDSSLAMEKMAREFGQAYSIRSAEADEIIYWADAAGTEEVTINVDNGNLIRELDGAEVILAANVEAFALSYRDVNNDSMTLPQDVASQKKRDDIRVITIDLAMHKEDEALNLSSSAYTRNQGLGDE
jgi:prepilin-type N-terminal cleavage/methylation domain-containing protein